MNLNLYINISYIFHFSVFKNLFHCSPRMVLHKVNINSQARNHFQNSHAQIQSEDRGSLVSISSSMNGP